MKKTPVDALYEIIEWLVADIFFVEEGISYLGTQGDIWDSQKDISVAFLGVVLATILYHVFRIYTHPRHYNN